MTSFRPVDPKVSFPDMEKRILEFWKSENVFEKSLEARADAPVWVFYEGPPTANGMPGVHHVEPRTFKDVYPRFKTMTGHRVPRKAGWDCHGLPVELEIEKEIGTKGKRDIEEFGIAKFNEMCRASVTRYVDEFERLTERIGFWLDMSDAYWTMSTEYIESVWWSLKELHRRGLLVQADKINAYCSRCGTALSDAEVALGYKTVEDNSVYLRFPLTEVPGAPELVDASLVVWTTTPWTLPSNEGAAVNAGATYVVVEMNGERLIVVEGLREKVLGEGGEVVARVTGEQLAGARYLPPYENVEDAHRVVTANFVGTEDGTGIVHIAPAFGADDLEVGLREGWPVYKPVDEAGQFLHPAPEFVHGRFVKDADPHIIEDLRDRGLLLKAQDYEHSYPFCWRCSTPLIYMARKSWYVRTTEVKERLLAVNEEVGWYPEHIRHGRYGNWLENNVDWALSRNRYWGTPLPVWICASEHETVVGSIEELGRLAGRDLSDLDPHRPNIDEVTISCPQCSESASRVPEVLDAWYDSGAMPFAQWGYHPELGRGIEEFKQAFPADFISEAIDQTRGWFYTLMAEGVLHFDSTAYRNVVCLGHILADDGRKMSKSLGNVFNPWEALDRQGADALRWFMLTSGSPWSPRRIGHEALDEVLRQFMLTLWNVYSFFVTYAGAEGWDPQSPAPDVADRPLMDRWILSRLASTVRTARDGLENYDATGAGKSIASLVEEISNWYVRRSRRRFWNPGGGGGQDASAAFHTLYECLTTLSLLLAPFTPFVAEEIWRNLAAGRGGRAESVHLSDFPVADASRIDESLERSMAAARAIVGLGRTVRVETKTKVRQPLSEAVVHYVGDHDALRPLLDIVAEELNVKAVVFAESAGEFGTWSAKPNFKVLGPRLGQSVKEVAAALAGPDGSAAAGRLAAGENATVATVSGPVELSPAEVELTQEVKQGWGVASEAGVTVALDLELTDDLKLEGIARELIRLVQDARKAAGLEVSDRIDLGVSASGDVVRALDSHGEMVTSETLALSLERSQLAGGYSQESVVDGSAITITLKKHS